MKKICSIVIWSFLASLIIGFPSLVRAVPLSLDQNIKAIVAKQEFIKDGFNFIVVGDSRDGAEVFSRLVNRAKTFDPLFILHTGDLVHGGQASEYEDYKKQLGPIEIPILHLPGNHDVRYGSENYQKYVGDPNWVFDLGNYRFIGLDNAKGNFTDEAMNFARKYLAGSKICFVAFHIPPAIGRWSVHAMVPDSQGGRGGEVMALIQAAKVPMVFLGHIHLYDEMTLNGTQYIISAGGGAKLYTKYSFGKPEFGFLLVRVRPNGITHQWIPLN